MKYAQIFRQLSEDSEVEYFHNDVIIFWRTIRSFKFVAGIATKNAITVMGAETVDEDSMEYAHATLISVNVRNRILIVDTLPKSPVIVLAKPNKLNEITAGISKHQTFYPEYLYDLGTQLYGNYKELHEITAVPYTRGKKTILRFAGKEELFGYPKIWDAYYFIPVMEAIR